MSDMQINPGDLPPTPIVMDGYAKHGFEPIADIFARLVASQGGGAALAIRVDGESVVDLWAGDYEEDTLQLVHSVSKVMSAVVAQMAVDEGLIDLDEPLSASWPEFDRDATRAITLRQVLQHRAGLAAVTHTSLTYEDLLGDGVIHATEQQDPLWEPGTAHGYHGFTLGTILDGVMRRRAGISVSDYLDKNARQPLGADMWIGLPDEQLHRVSPVRYARPAITPLQLGRLERGEMIIDQHFVPFEGHKELFNSKELLQAQWPAVNGVTQARALAKLIAATMAPVDGIRLVSERGFSELTTSASKGPDRILGVPSQFSTGLQLTWPQLPFLGPGSFGHEAAGGSVAFGDTDYGVAVGFTTNQQGPVNGATPPALALFPSIRHLLIDN